MTDSHKQRNSAGIPRRPLGRTGVEVSALGLGGWDIAVMKDDRDCIRLVHEAIDHGITFLDNAWDYHNGRSEDLMGRAISDRRDRAFLMTKMCTHGRNRQVAMRQLEDSLRRLRTDYLDLWQIHEVVYDNEPALHFAADGAVEALEQARREGKVRFVGFTGHKSPELHLQMLAYDFAFDTCQLPLNCFDASFRSFEQQVLPELSRRGIAAIGMKSMGGDGGMVAAGAVTAQEALRYAMSLPVATTVSGICSFEMLRQNIEIASRNLPMSADEMQQLRERCRALAADGRYELYKTSAKFEGPEGRRQHGFPTQDELTA